MVQGTGIECNTFTLLCQGTALVNYNVYHSTGVLLVLLETRHDSLVTQMIRTNSDSRSSSDSPHRLYKSNQGFFYVVPVHGGVRELAREHFSRKLTSRLRNLSFKKEDCF